jgi:hypothetical protein
MSVNGTEARSQALFGCGFAAMVIVCLQLN